jgi:hypothetical protein
MAYNEDDDRKSESGEGILPGAGPSAGAVHAQVQVPVQGPVQGVSAVVNEEAAQGGTQGLTIEEQMNRAVFERFRSLFHDVSDDRFTEIVRALTAAESINSIAQKLIESGYCAHLKPSSVRMYLCRFREAMDWPKYRRSPVEPAVEEIVEATGAVKEEDEQLIEEAPVMRRLGWLIRIQQARVRKALSFEGQMAGMILPMASSEIKLLSDLLDKEIAVSVKTGEVKTIPQAVKLDVPGIGIIEPAEAYKVVLAYKRLKALLAPRVAAPDGEPGDRTIDVSPGSDSAGAASIDGRADAGGGDAVGTPLPGAAESGPVGPGPGADGAHGRT